MRARWSAWVVVVCACVCVCAAPVEPPPAPVPCFPLQARTAPRPYNAHHHEDTVVDIARALSKLIKQGEADEPHAADLAKFAAQVALSPPPAAVALGAPQLHLGVLYLAHVDPPRLVVFQQNNSASLQQFWRTLASAWNSSSVVWSGSWISCDLDPRSWWSGIAAAQGVGPLRAAVAIFRRLPSVPCDPALYDWMGGTPNCDPMTTDCEALPAPQTTKFMLEYRCRCREGYWLSENDSRGWWPGAALASGAAGDLLKCEACSGGDTLDYPSACLGDLARATLLAANLAGILVCFLIAIIIFKKRKCKAVAMGMWTVLEVILLGAVLMYASAASQYLWDASWRCVLGAWLRELGFVACYGSVVLRLWVLLAEFRTRKAHRWTPRDAEVLKIVCAMLIGAACYLAAFTATAACSDAPGQGCARTSWHHVTAAAELLLLIAGLKLAYAARNANVPFQERGWLATALSFEGFCVVSWRGAALAGMAPEWSPLTATARAHFSSGAALACVLAPRLWHGYRARSLAQEVSRRGPAEGFGFEGEEEPTSEEVRAELKRLYVQLEILRNKTLRRDNPHISKRRGGRKPPHRRFSLQALQARRGGKNKAGGSASAVEVSEAGDVSRTPEDSVCSAEGPSHYMDGETQA